jgi:transposase
MGRVSFGDEFKRDAVAQIMERGYPAAEVFSISVSAGIRCISGRSTSRRQASGDASKGTRSGSWTVNWSGRRGGT